MKLGIFSDIHANLEALQRALDFFQEQRIDKYLCLGDIVGYGADPEECVALVRALPIVAVAGNHDRAVVARTELARFNTPARLALQWTREQLTPSSRAFLAKLKLVQIDRQFRLVHASPSSPAEWRYVLSEVDIAEELDAFKEQVCLIGHSHRPFAVAEGKGGIEYVSEPEFTVSGTLRYLINVGSVGQPRDGDPRLCVVIYDSEIKRLSFHRLEYDLVTAQNKMRAVGLPEVLARRLSSGR